MTNKELITSQRDEILKMLYSFGATTMFGTEIAEVWFGDSLILSCQINYELGRHTGYFSLYINGDAKAYDFPVIGIRFGDFDWVKDAFWLYLKMVKVYCGGSVE